MNSALLSSTSGIKDSNSGINESTSGIVGNVRSVDGYSTVAGARNPRESLLVLLRKGLVSMATRSKPGDYFLESNKLF